MEKEIKLSDLREKFRRASVRPKRLRFFSELCREAQDFAVSEERDSSEKDGAWAMSKFEFYEWAKSDRLKSPNNLIEFAA